MDFSLTDNGKFLQCPVKVSSITETPSAAHKDCGLWLFRLLKGVSYGPARPYRRRFEFYCLSHLIEGRGFYWTEEEGARAMEPGWAALMPPGKVHAYGGFKDIYVEDAICFYGPVADCFLKYGLIKPGLLKIGAARRLLPPLELAQDPAPESQIRASLAMQDLLAELAAENRQLAAGADMKIELLLSELRLDAEGWWTVAGMAERCSLSVAQFRRRFEELVGMPPKRYVEELRMRKAAEDLVRLKESVAEVAKKYSYKDPYHFSRRFKKLMGLPPGKYSKNPPRPLSAAWR